MRGQPAIAREILDVISEMQAWKLVPEAYLVEPGCDLPEVVRDALAQGIRMFVVCGGDGTISAVAGTLAGTPRHPGDHPHRNAEQHGPQPGHPCRYPGCRRHPAHGPAHQSGRWHGRLRQGSTHLLLEVCSVGLVSALFPSADDIQHGNLARVGDFLATLVASPPAEIHLVLDGKQEIHSLGHVVLVSNMPYIGLHYRVGDADSFNDGLLDVLFFADLSKLDLLGYVFQGVGTVGRKTHASSTTASAGWILTPTLPCRSWPMGTR